MCITHAKTTEQIWMKFRTKMDIYEKHIGYWILKDEPKQIDGKTQVNNKNKRTELLSQLIWDYRLI